jgi:hypothetical protein
MIHDLCRDYTVVRFAYMTPVWAANSGFLGGRRSHVIRILILLSLAGISCNITEPEPFENPAAHAPTITNARVRGIQPGQHIAGIFLLSVDSVVSSAPIDHADLYINGLIVGSSASNGSLQRYEFSVDTRGFTDREYTLQILFVLKKDPSLGLLNLLSQIGISVSASVFFDNAAPTKPKNIQWVWINHPTCTWSQNQDPNFRGYIIRRSTPTALVDTIPDRSVTSFVDTSLRPVYGEQAVYVVSAWNGSTETAADPVTATYGTILALGTCVYLVPNPVSDEIYLHIAAGPVYAFSTLTNVQLRNTSALGLPNQLCITWDGTLLTSFDRNSRKIHRVYTTGFIPLPDVSLDSLSGYPVGMAATATRIYLTLGADLAIYESGTGHLVAVIRGILPRGGGRLMLSPDERALYLSTEQYLTRLAINGDSLVVSATRSFNNFIGRASPIAGTSLVGVTLQTFPNGGGSGVEIVDASSLVTVRALAVPQEISTYQVQDGCFSSRRGYITFASVATSQNPFIYEFDLQSGTVIHRWEFDQNTPTPLAVARNGAFVYAGGSTPPSAVSTPVTWVIPLQ